MACPEPIAPSSITPRPAINQQQGDLWAAIAAASAHLPEIKAAMRMIDKALSNTAPSHAATTADYRPTTSDATLLSALHKMELWLHTHTIPSAHPQQRHAETVRPVGSTVPPTPHPPWIRATPTFRETAGPYTKHCPRPTSIPRTNSPDQAPHPRHPGGHVRGLMVASIAKS